MTHHITLSRLSRSSLCALPLALLLATGCGQSQGQVTATNSSAEADEPSRRPSAKDMLEATAPDYVSPAGIRQECLGRLVFDLAGPIEWPTFYNADEPIFNHTFSKRVFDRGDEMKFGDTHIAVIGPSNPALVKDVLHLTPFIRIETLKEEIKELRADIVTLNNSNSDTPKRARYLKEAEEEIRRLDKRIKEDGEKYKIFNTGLPNSEAYWAKEVNRWGNSTYNSIFKAYLMRENYIYVFESDREVKDAAEQEKHKQNFLKLLKNFRVRQPNEIPTELGVCIPHGFIPDDGTTFSEFKQSLRWPDAHGVLYTIHTGNVESHRMKVPAMLAAIRAGLGTFGSEEEKKINALVKERIGPRPYKIGGLTGEQGGFVLNIHRTHREESQPFTKTISIPLKKKDHEKYEVYSVFTGYSGWLATAVLPYILVELNTLHKHQAAELKQNPPPFKQSKPRLELLLKSMRLRPTNPLMPELVDLPK